MKISLDDLLVKPFDPGRHPASAFDCGDSDLNEFLQKDAHQYQQEHLSFTRVVFLHEDLVGYITLLTDSIVLKSSEKRKLSGFHRHVMQWPALKIGRLAICKPRQRKQGIGCALLRYAVGVAVRLGRESGIGCRFITVDAYPASVSFYEKYGFVPNKHYEPRSKSASGWSRFFPAFFRKSDPTVHPSMRYDILKGPKI